MINAGRRNENDTVERLMKQAEKLRDSGRAAREKSYKNSRLYEDIHKGRKTLLQEREEGKK